MNHIPQNDEYFVSFDTKINPGKIDAVRIRIDNVTIEDMDASMKLDLCNHPLYADLKRYVQGNP